MVFASDGGDRARQCFRFSKTFELWHAAFAIVEHIMSDSQHKMASHDPSHTAGESSNPIMHDAAVPKPRKRFVGASSRPTARKGEGKARPAPRRVANLIPDEILNDKDLNEAIKGGWIVFTAPDGSD